MKTKDKLFTSLFIVSVINSLFLLFLLGTTTGKSLCGPVQGHPYLGDITTFIQLSPAGYTLFSIASLLTITVVVLGILYYRAKK